ncbi:MAG TPA: 6-carboxytetrahydropterin synthase [Candidatus Caccomonas pullistercoris]|nr:6-carboxytetrahydropterin synthase [Candidatus Caccomonas pullistercoris]
MYYVSKRMEIAMAHQLTTSYDKRCRNLHGHNAIVTVYCCSEQLNTDGMVVDFKKIKDAVTGRLDHAYVNDVVDFNPTAENLARWICEQIPNCYKVKFQESEGNVAVYVKEGYEQAAL